MDAGLVTTNSEIKIRSRVWEFDMNQKPTGMGARTLITSNSDKTKSISIRERQPEMIHQWLEHGRGGKL